MRRKNVFIFSCILTTACVSWFSSVAAEPQIAAASVLENAPASDQSSNPPTNSPTAIETVTVIGGSMAHGWKAPHNNSYIKQAFASLTNSTQVQYVYSDRTIIGETAASLATKQPAQFESWIAQDRPQVVVISWGLMDDIYDKTPLSDFDQAIQSEIQQSLDAHAVVLVITPPVVQGAMSALTKQNRYIASEFRVAEAFDSPNVRTFDVFGDMLTYTQTHQQSLQPYFGDNWHPNGAGHQLGGQLLYNELIDTFGLTPIRFLCNSNAFLPT